jgi:hypothetical protein
MIDRSTLISELDSILKTCVDSVNNLLVYQKMNQNDARVTFFKHFINVLDSTILSLIVAHKYFGNYEWWKEVNFEYNLTSRPVDYAKEMDYYDQVITLSYFVLTFGSFESSLRLICKQHDPSLYQTQRDFNPLCKGIVRKLKLKNRDKFIDLIAKLRNAIHTNGLYVPKGNMKNDRIFWNKMIFVFNENKPITFQSLWSSLIPISREIIHLFNEIINSNDIKSISYYPDPTEL